MQKGFAPILVLVGILVMVGIASGIYYLGKSQVSKSQVNVVVSQTPQPSSVTEGTSKWKVYQEQKFGFEFKYPINWYTSQYGNGDCVDFSDIPNPQDIPATIKPEKHNVVKVCINIASMPTSFPYTNGSSENPTIKPYAANNNKGIQGKQTSTLGEEDVIMLRNPLGGFVEIIRALNGTEAFDQILSTFKFTQ